MTLASVEPTPALPSLATWHPFLAPYLPRELGSVTRERLATTAAQFPVDTMAVLEIPLPAEPCSTFDADFALRLTSAAGADHVARAHGSHANPAQTVVDRWAAWSSPDQPAHRRLGPCWLEFDWSSRGGGALPIVCFQVPAALDREFFLDEVLVGLGATSPSGRELWRRVLANLPAGARVLYVFDLRARGHDAQRCELFGLDPRQSERLLRELGLDPLAALIPSLASWTGRGERPHLSFDIGPEGALDRVGLENSFRRQPQNERGWSEVLAAWVSSGRVRSELASQLLAFSGTSSRSNTPAWPTEPPLARGWLVRALSHWKAAARPGKPVELKAYLLWQFLPRLAGSRANLPAKNEAQNEAQNKAPGE